MCQAKSTILSVCIVLTMLVFSVIPIETQGETWEQTTTSDFEDGETFFVDTSTGALKLSRSLTGTWCAQGETAVDYFGYSVAGAGDVNGDGYDDVIVGAIYNDDGGNNAGKAYVYYGSASGLSTTSAWSDQGEAESDYFGGNVARAGDVNGDGYDDVIVGAYYNDDGGNNAGKAYVYHGSASGPSATPDWYDQGEAANDFFGISVASAGDVNDDGYDDVIVGAYGNDDGASMAGEAYVYHGSTSGLTQDADPNWSDQGEAAGDNFGYSVADAGDVNGDGYADVIIGAHYNDDAGSMAGEAYVYHGSSSGLTQDAAPNWYVQGEDADDYFGISVASAGDVNGDGYDDVIIGAYGDNGVSTDVGEAYVYYGSTSGLTQDADPDWSDQGEAAGDKLGRSVAGAGDVNGDGYDDVIVGARYNDDGGSSAGEAYVYHGSASGLSTTSAWSDQGEAANDFFGYSVASAGDVNGDGYDDVIIGAYGNDGGGSMAGEAYVYHGSASGLSTTSAWSDQGEAASDLFGNSVAGAGDVNGDGYDDVIIGAYGNDDGGSYAGEAYVYHGSSAGLSATPDWYDQGEAADDNFGYSVAGAGDVNGDGYDDVIVGAYGNDDGGIMAGEAYVYHGSSSGLTQDAAPNWYDQGEAAHDYFGRVASAGDVNGDGYDDVIVGAYGNDGGGSMAGEAYVYHGSSSGLTQDAAPNWYVQGEAAGDNLGIRSVATAGDVNGDGYDDVIVTSPLNDDAGSAAGEAYVYHGSSSGLTQDAVPNWYVQGEAAGDNLGIRSVATAGDVNGDGYDDVIVGADGNDDAGSSAGEAYVYHGSAAGLSTTPAWSDQGEAADDDFGYSVAGAGDVNGDGYADVIVGARYNDDAASNAGKAYVYSYGLSVTLPAWNPWEDQGESGGDLFGTSVAGAGDVNGDGYNDVIVGAYGNDGGSIDFGEAYVYHGSASGLSATPDWSDQGEAAYDYFGFSVATAGDVNGDGYDDVIVGAYGNDDGGNGAGEAYVYHGSSSGLSSTPDWSDQGEAAGDKYGYSVAGAGDVNGDGYDDVIVGAYANSGGGSAAGEAYVLHGSSSGLSSTPDWSDQGEAIGDWFGYSVAGAGDVNGDGYDDVIVGAPYNNGGAGSNTGEAYVYHGSASGLSTTPDWSDQGEAAEDYFGISVAGAGDVNGDGYADVIVGAYENDDGGSGAGEAYVYHGMSADPGLSATPDWSDQGEAADDYFGGSVAGAGDVNGDGYADVIVGATNNDDGGSNAGEAYVYHGKSADPGLSATPDWSDQGEAGGDLSGKSVAGAGDVNGDGYDDVIIGAWGNDGAGTDAGEAYVYHSSGYMVYGVYESAPFTVATTDGVDWLTLSWNPTTHQPIGTSVKALIGISDDGSSWSWHGPTGTSTTYFTNPAGQDIYSGDRGKYLKVRFIFERDATKTTRTPTVTDFTITYGTFTKPTVTLNWPNGGENLIHGTSYGITWTTTGDLSSSDPVALSYSLNSGSTWTDITTGTANDGTHLWTLPSNEDVEKALVKIVVTAPDGSTVEDTSDATFSIDPPPEVQQNPDTMDRIITPSSGNTFAPGAPLPISWQLQHADLVSLFYSIDFGENWMTIIEEIPNTQYYNWLTPEDMTSYNVMIRVEGGEEGGKINLMSGVFSIGPEQPDLTEDGPGEDGPTESEFKNQPEFYGFVIVLMGLFMALAWVVKPGGK